MQSCSHAVLQSYGLAVWNVEDCTTARLHDRTTMIKQKRALSDSHLSKIHSSLLPLRLCAFAPLTERLIPERTLKRSIIPLAAHAIPWRRWIWSHHNQRDTIVEDDLLNNRGNIFLLQHG